MCGPAYTQSELEEMVRKSLETLEPGEEDGPISGQDAYHMLRNGDYDRGDGNRGKPIKKPLKSYKAAPKPAPAKPATTAAETLERIPAFLLIPKKEEVPA